MIYKKATEGSMFTTSTWNNLLRAEAHSFEVQLEKGLQSVLDTISCPSLDIWRPRTWSIYAFDVLRDNCRQLQRGSHFARTSSRIALLVLCLIRKRHVRVCCMWARWPS